MYEVGDAVSLSFRVLDQARRLTDADVTLTVTTPAGTSAEIEPEHAGVGQYTASYTPAIPGRYVYRWRATGAANQSYTDVLNVVSATEPVSIISLGKAKAFLNMTEDWNEEDEELREFVAAASRVVEEYTGEIVARRTVVEDHHVGAGGVLLLRPPVQVVTSVTSLDGLTDYGVPGLLDGQTGVASGVSATGWVRVTYVAGRSVVPEHYETATAIIAAHLWTTQRPAPVGGPGFGGVEAAPNPGRGYLIPNQAAQLLGGRAPNSP
jgi:hypothetical protein